MSPSCSSDFTYAHFREILGAAKSSFDVRTVAESPHVLQRPGRRALILRHDVDLDLRAALRMAEIEGEFPVKATYMVMLNSPWYRLEESSSLAVLRELLSMGHEVSLHFDFDDEKQRTSASDYARVEPLVRSAAARLEELTGRPVKSVSFHRPIPELIRGPLVVAGLVNAYAAELMQWYISDSRARWREGDPLPMLLKPKCDFLQLLIHPIWWAQEHREGAERLEDFFQLTTRNMSRKQKQSYSDALAAHLTIRRAA